MTPILLLATLMAPAHADQPLDLSVDSWIAMGPVVDAQPQPLQVYEVFATWCGACFNSFDHVSALQKQWGNRVRVAAITDERPELVRRFFHENKEHMRFAVGVTDSETIQSLMFGGYGGRGLPSAYIVVDGKVEWGGHPSDLEQAVAAYTR